MTSKFTFKKHSHLNEDSNLKYRNLNEFSKTFDLSYNKIRYYNITILQYYKFVVN